MYARRQGDNNLSERADPNCGLYLCRSAFLAFLCLSIVYLSYHVFLAKNEVSGPQLAHLSQITKRTDKYRHSNR